MTAFSRTAVRTCVWRLAAAVAAVALLAYGAAVAGVYAFDDIHSVSSNPALHDLGNLGRYWIDPSAFSPGSGRMYRPFLLTTFALNHAVSPAAWSLKAGNVLLHAAVAVLLFAWLWRLSRRARACAAVAALFAAHPLASEAVNLVSARSEVLMVLGALVALHGHLTWLRRGHRGLAVAGMVAGMVVACGSKETGVVVPCVAAVQAWLLRPPRDGVAARGRLPGRGRGPALRAWLLGLAPLVAAAVVYLVARKLLLGGVAVPLLDRTGDDPLNGAARTLGMQLATMGTLLPGCVLQLVAPFRLTVDPVVVYRASFLDPAVLLGWGTMLALTVWACWRGPRARLRRIGVVLAWSSALPWIVVPLNMPLAEHRLYAPLAGAALIAAAAATALGARLRRLQLARPGGHRAWRHAPRVALATALLAGVTWSTRQSLLYRDEVALWQAALVHAPESFRAWWGIGTARLRAGDAEGSIDPLARAHALCPTHFDTHRNYVEALVSLPDAVADPERSLAVAARLLERSPRDPWSRTLQAQAHLQAGRVRGDREHFVAAERTALSCLEVATPKGYVYQLAAQARRGLGDLPGALAHLDTSIARGLAPVGVRLDRAALLRELGRPGDAHRELLRAQREFPNDPRTLQALLQAMPPR